MKIRNLVIPEPNMVINDRESKYMIMVRLGFSLILRSSKYLAIKSNSDT